MYARFGKRLFDVLFSLLGLLAVFPVFLIVPVWIKLDSPGPVFFKQRRMGRGGKVFMLTKFRSMAEDPKHERKSFEPGAALRVTKAGKLLRKTKVDEIPQLLNVLKGDMSFVGPRPEVERYKLFYAEEYADVLSVRPGITDRASIKYRHEEEILAKSASPEKAYAEVILPDKLEIALAYVRSGISLTKDIQIIGRTLLSIVKRVE